MPIEHYRYGQSIFLYLVESRRREKCILRKAGTDNAGGSLSHMTGVCKHIITVTKMVPCRVFGLLSFYGMTWSRRVILIFESGHMQLCLSWR